MESMDLPQPVTDEKESEPEAPEHTGSEEEGKVNQDQTDAETEEVKGEESTS